MSYHGVNAAAKMTNNEIAAMLRNSIGRRLRLELDNTTEEVRIITADPDGVECRSLSVREDDSSNDFWIAYSAIRSVEEI